MAYNWFRPKGGRFGVAPVVLEATIAPGTNSLTANSTTTYYIPTPYRRLRFARAASQCTTVPVDSDGTATAIVYKVVGTDTTALTAALSLEALTANVAAVFTSTATEPSRAIAPGNTLKVVVTNSSAAVDTHPVDLKFVVECEVIN